MPREQNLCRLAQAVGHMDSIGALERCSYCRRYVPVTRLTLPSGDPEDVPIRATIAVCEGCRGDGR